MTAGFGSAGHLARRFVGSLWPGGPSEADDAWAWSFLNVGEQALWAKMSGPDRRHALAVARRLLASDASAVSRDSFLAAVPAALLHDVGKLASGLGTLRRTAATVVTVVVGRPRVARGSGAMARYLRHDLLGADLLAGAGSDPLTVAWAREHHWPAERWSLPRPLAGALKAADDDAGPGTEAGPPVKGRLNSP